MLDLLIKGGPVMVPIGICAVLATIIIIERLLFYRSLYAEQRKLQKALDEQLKNGRMQEAEALCGQSETPMARLAEAGLAQRERGEATIKEAILNASNREVPRLERFISPLGTIANISTLLGLLGTVTGNIRAFGVLAASGAMGNPALLAGAIAEALVTTAAGLIISIPATVFYNYFTGLANKTMIQLESWSGDLVIRLTSRVSKSNPMVAREAGRAL